MQTSKTKRVKKKGQKVFAVSSFSPTFLCSSAAEQKTVTTNPPLSLQRTVYKTAGLLRSRF